MSDNIHFEIVTPVSAVYSGEATSVILPSQRGEVEILPGHRAMLSLIQHGTVVVTEVGGAKKVLVVEPGYVETVDNKVTLLVAGCLHSADVDVEASRADVLKGEKVLQAPDLLTEEQLAEERNRYERARARVAMVERATKG